MSLRQHILNVFQIYQPQKKWKTIYWLVDVHGVILPPSFHKKNDFRFIHSDAEEVLRWIARTPGQMLIPWTSSYNSELGDIHEWLLSHDIFARAFNCNPFESNTEYANFDKKPYYNILIDDKAGFMPGDWTMVKDTLKELGIWRNWKLRKAHVLKSKERWEKIMEWKSH